MTNKIAALLATAFIWALGYSTIWLYNRYFDDGAPVEQIDVAMFLALFTVYALSNHFIEHKDKEKEDG